MNKKINKSSINKIFTGTCGGLGEFFELDPVFIRVAFIILAFTGTIGIWIYLICVILIPAFPADSFECFETMDTEDVYSSITNKDKNKQSIDQDFDSYFEK